ncbi:hypothetical protein VPH35_098396 [Triticum aestivum]
MRKATPGPTLSAAFPHSSTLFLSLPTLAPPLWLIPLGSHLGFLSRRKLKIFHGGGDCRRVTSPACRSGGRPPQDLLKSFSIAPLLVFSTPGQPLLIPNISSSDSVLSEILPVQIACWNLLHGEFSHEMFG